MLYNNIIGQDEAKLRLKKMIREQRVPHALMFTGKEGTGNLPAAIAFIQNLYCTQKTDDGACGECNSCLKVNKLIHPDMHFVFPIAKSKDVKCSADLIGEFREAFLQNNYITLNQWFNEISADNKQPIIPVEEANAILKTLSYTSYEGSYKTMLVWLPEKMNTEAANKLLKVLEEPPDETIFVLVSNSPEQLLPTILSRVQQIPFYALADIEIELALQKQFNITSELAKQTALLAGGSYSEAITTLVNNEESVSLLTNFQNFMRLALKFDCNKVLQWIDEMSAVGREKQKQFFQYGLEVFRDALMYNYGEKKLVRLGGSEKQFLEKFSPFINQNNYEKLIDEFNTNYYYIERNANPKLIFMDLFLKTNELLNLK